MASVIFVTRCSLIQTASHAKRWPLRNVCAQPVVPGLGHTAEIKNDRWNVTSRDQMKPAGALSLYERMGERTTQPFALQVLDRLMPLEGLSIIDIAAGTGGLAVAAAERGAKVLAVDINAAMIERTQQRLQPFGSCRAEIMDFRRLTAADGAFDIAVSSFGILAYPTWQEGLREMLRTTRPGGRVALVMWTHRHDCSPAHLMKRAFQELFPDRTPWPVDLFPVFFEEHLVSALRSAGCSDVSVEVASANWSPYSSADVVNECDPMFKGFPGYAALTQTEVERLRPSLESAFYAYAQEDGTIRLPTKAFLMIARKGPEV